MELSKKSESFFFIYAALWYNAAFFCSEAVEICFYVFLGQTRSDCSSISKMPPLNVFPKNLAGHLTLTDGCSCFVSLNSASVHLQVPLKGV